MFPIVAQAVCNYLLVSSADDFCKQFESWSGSIKYGAWSGSNLFKNSDGIAKIFFLKSDFEKKKTKTSTKKKQHAKS